MSPRSLLLLCLAAVAINATAPVSAAEIVVKVTGVGDARGRIGCALYRSADGFPMDNTRAVQVWVAADPKGTTCRFADIADGRYAVSVAHDFNGNGKVDTNFVGIPTEPWGVSNNARPTLRPPKFDEGAFTVAGNQDTTLEVKVAK
jgi:uncharacterized protein (DUF2141 family)